MSDQDPRFTIHLEHLEGYEFRVRFDWDTPDLLMDEPAPLGAEHGPNATRLLAAAAANCLSASLLYCAAKNDAPAGALNTTATCTLTRNEKGRLRIGALKVEIRMTEALQDSPRTHRCLDLFEDFCVVTASLRDGIPVEVEVSEPDGTVVHRGA